MLSHDHNCPGTITRTTRTDWVASRVADRAADRVADRVHSQPATPPGSRPGSTTVNRTLTFQDSRRPYFRGTTVCSTKLNFLFVIFNFARYLKKPVLERASGLFNLRQSIMVAASAAPTALCGQCALSEPGSLASVGAGAP